MTAVRYKKPNIEKRENGLPNRNLMTQKSNGVTLID